MNVTVSTPFAFRSANRLASGGGVAAGTGAGGVGVCVGAGTCAVGAGTCAAGAAAATTAGGVSEAVFQISWTASPYGLSDTFPSTHTFGVKL